MSDHTPGDRALCCGATCHRGTDATGPCIAATYGAGIRQRAEAAGYTIHAAANPTRLAALEAVAEAARGLQDVGGVTSQGLFRALEALDAFPPPQPPQPAGKVLKMAVSKSESGQVLWAVAGSDADQSTPYWPRIGTVTLTIEMEA